MLMHETIVAQSVFETILEHANELGKKPVSAKISCGQLNPINDEVMNFAFEAAAGGTVCEGVKLVVEHIPLKAKCNECSEVFDFDIYAGGCVKCKSIDIKFEPDAPLLLEEIEFQDDE